MSASQSRGGRFASRPGARSLAPGGYYCGWVPRWLRTKLSQVGTSWHTMFEELVGTCRAPLIGKVRARLCFAYLTLSYVIPVTLTQKVADVVLHPRFTLLSLVVFRERADKPGELFHLLLLSSLQCFLWIYQISASWCYRYVLSLAPPEALDSCNESQLRAWGISSSPLSIWPILDAEMARGLTFGARNPVCGALIYVFKRSLDERFMAALEFRQKSNTLSKDTLTQKHKICRKNIRAHPQYRTRVPLISHLEKHCINM